MATSALKKSIAGETSVGIWKINFHFTFFFFSKVVPPKKEVKAKKVVS
jgi:hypothetical protein